jgi:hypothetical protein
MDNWFFLSLHANRGRSKIIIIKKQQKGGRSHVLWLSDNTLVVKITLVFSNIYVWKNNTNKFNNDTVVFIFLWSYHEMSLYIHIWKAIWLASVWTIWKEKNNKVFDYKELSPDKLIYNIKLLMWWWLKVRKKDFCFDLNFWLLNPSACSRLLIWCCYVTFECYIYNL